MPEEAVPEWVTASSASGNVCDHAATREGAGQTPTRANASREIPFSSTAFDHSRALCRLWSR